jgi:hypothetical protein
MGYDSLTFKTGNNEKLAARDGEFDSFCLTHYPMLILTRGSTGHEMPPMSLR